MHMAAANGNIAQLNLVVEFVPQRIDETDSNGTTPLHVAARNDQEAAVSLLLSAKADVNKTDDFGRTPLYYANVIIANVIITEWANDYEVKQLLRDAGGHDEGLPMYTHTHGQSHCTGAQA